MHRQAFCSALERTARRVLPAGHVASLPRQSPANIAATSKALFSSTAPQAVLKHVPGRQDRLAAAASQLSSLENNNNNNNGAPRTSDAHRVPGGWQPVPNPHFTRGPPPPSEDAPTSGGDGSRIISVRSLPRRPLGSGSRFPGPSGVTSRSPTGRFAGSVGGRQPAKRRRPARRRRRNGGDKEGDGKKFVREEATWSQTQLDWMYADEVGTAKAFEPALTLEGLAAYSPAIASAAAGSSGNVSSAVRAMRLVAGGAAFGGGQEEGASVATATLSPAAARARLEKGEAVFFDTAGERASVDAALHSHRATKWLASQGLPAEMSLIGPVGDGVKTAIVETAVRGLYATPETEGTAAGVDAGTLRGSLLETAQRYRAKNYTYSAAQAATFDGKIRELLPQAAAGGKAAKGGKARRA